MTALVVQDLLSGDLCNHYWNRRPDGTEIDLTADQLVAARARIRRARGAGELNWAGLD